MAYNGPPGTQQLQFSFRAKLTSATGAAYGAPGFQQWPPGGGPPGGAGKLHNK
jgi:hypothetical protein